MTRCPYVVQAQGARSPCGTCGLVALSSHTLFVPMARSTGRPREMNEACFRRGADCIRRTATRLFPLPLLSAWSAVVVQRCFRRDVFSVPYSLVAGVRQLAASTAAFVAFLSGRNPLAHSSARRSLKTNGVGAHTPAVVCEALVYLLEYSYRHLAVPYGNPCGGQGPG